MRKLMILAVLLTASCSRQVTFMSYNIRNGNGMDDQRDLGRVAAVMASSGADFIAVQEVDSMTGRSGETYVLGELAEMTGMDATFAPAIDYDGGKYGIGLLSREKPLGSRIYPLPGREERRVLLVAEFEELYVCTAHFSLTEEDRIASAETVLRVLSTLDKPALFAGDLNAFAESAEITLLRESLVSLLCGEKTWQADTPTEAIDYIFGKDVTLQKSCVIEEKVASDHRPVLARVTLR